jgi:hypothetical protein
MDITLRRNINHNKPEVHKHRAHRGSAENFPFYLSVFPVVFFNEIKISRLIFSLGKGYIP